jgi:hypothetical protein
MGSTQENIVWASGTRKAMALDVAMQGPKVKSSTRKMPLVKEPWHSSDLERGRAGGGTFSVKFEIYVPQLIIFRGLLDNCPTYFLPSYYYLIF